jgi:prepilin-type N-terminal cleavage/methylation domain-containing protein
VRIKRPYGAWWQSEAAKPLAWHGAAIKRAGGTPVPLRSRGFTLIELILVMALLVIGVSFITPQLGGFFRGRTMQSEARQIIALSHNAQSRAVSGGVPIILWVDAENKKYGIEEEPGYNDKDPNAVSFDVNENLKVEIPQDDPSQAQLMAQSDNPHMNLPKITFLPDGTIGDGSPKTIQIVDDNGPTLSVTQARDHNQYEIGTNTDQQ